MSNARFAGRHILVTGAAGFIGMHAAKALLKEGATVTGVDSFDPYYDVRLKQARAETLQALADFTFERLDLADDLETARLFKQGAFDGVVHLAAQPGVRYSLIDPGTYLRNNIVAFGNVLEGCRHAQIAHLVYASSSSVYGANHTLPFSEDQSVDQPQSLYAATKKANELMAHTYSSLFGLATTGLRFFTVYGPWGRPDMALFLFTRNILADQPIDVFNHGKHTRGFTYVDDIVEGVIRVLDQPAAASAAWSGARPDPATSRAPYRIYNIGSDSATQLMRYIELIEENVGKKARLNLLPLQPGDVPDTSADVEELMRDVGYSPTTPVEVGVRRFVEWYTSYYRR